MTADLLPLDQCIANSEKFSGFQSFFNQVFSVFVFWRTGPAFVWRFHQPASFRNRSASSRVFGKSRPLNGFGLRTRFCALFSSKSGSGSFWVNPRWLFGLHSIKRVAIAVTRKSR